MKSRLLIFASTIMFTVVSLQAQNVSVPISECCGMTMTQDTCVTYAYNNSDNIISRTIKTSGDNFTRVTYNYNSSQNVTKETHAEWDGGTWVSTYELKNTYTSSQAINIQTIRVSDGAGGLVNSTMEDFDYNGSGNVTKHTQYEWDGSDWAPVYELKNTYTSSQAINIQTIRVSDGAGGLVNSTMEDFDYNGSGNITKHTQYEWDGSDWAPTYELKNTYTSSQAINIQTIRMSDGAGGLVNSTMEDFDYNGSGNVTKHSQYEWDGSDWVSIFELRNTYTSSQNINIQTIKVSDGAGGLVNSSQVDYDYNSNGELTKEKQFVWDGSDWSIDENCAYTWKVIGTVSTEDLTNEKLVDCIFANPVYGSTNVNCSFEKGEYSYLIYNMLGNVIEQNSIDKFTAIEIGAKYTSGSYVLTILNERGIVYNRKFVVVQ